MITSSTGSAQCEQRKLGVFAIRFSLNFAIGFADSPAFAWLAKRLISQQRKAFRSSFAVVTFLKRSLTALRMAHTRRIPSPLPSELKCELEDAFDRMLQQAGGGYGGVPYMQQQQQ
jgi:hypothetical protein